jgi:predicted O-methyltransferase YrrM
MKEPKQDTVASQSRMLRSEIQAILDVIPQQGVVLEIGTFHGLTVSKWAIQRPGVVFVSVDPLRWRSAGLKWYDNRRPNMRLMTGTVDDLVLLAVGAIFDVAVVDGDHAFDACHHDLEVCRTLIKPDGVLVAHDYAVAAGKRPQKEVKPAVDAFCEKHGYRIDLVVGTTAFLRQKPE